MSGRSTLRRRYDSAVTSFRFEAIRSLRCTKWLCWHSFQSQETSESYETAARQLRAHFGEPLIVNEDGVDIPRYVLRATANTGKRIILEVALYKGINISTRHGRDPVTVAACRQLWALMSAPPSDRSPNA